MTDTDPPKIEFPCEYPIKVLGRNSETFRPTILEIFERLAPGFDADNIVSKSSRGDKFVSLTIVIEATGEPQLKALHEALMATGMVSMVI